MSLQQHIRQSFSRLFEQRGPLERARVRRLTGIVMFTSAVLPLREDMRTLERP